MFLLVSVRHVGAHPAEHQHGVSIQISISLGKTFLRISRIRNIPLTWILARVFVYVPPFISQILDFIYWTVLIFILIYFEWRDTENQQLISKENGPVLLFKTIFCFENVSCRLLQPMARMDMDWNPTFSGFYAIPAKLAQTIMMVSVSWWNFCDNYFIALQEHCVHG